MSATTRWLGRLALRPDRPLGRLVTRAAAAWLCARVGRRWRAAERATGPGWIGKRHTFTDTNTAVVRIMCLAQDEWAARRAMRVLVDLSDDVGFLGEVLACFTSGSCPLTPAAASFLLAPPPAARLVRFLTTEDRPRFMQVSNRGVAKWLVDAAVNAADEQGRTAAAELLQGTDQADLLEALEEAFLRAVGNLRRAHGNDLWTEDRPTPLTTILQANRNLPPSMDGVSPGNYTMYAGVLLAVLTDRLDLVGEYVRVRGAYGTINTLIDGAGFPAPGGFIEGCRRALRDLEPGPGREELCRQAADGRAEARAAVVDAGFMWSGDPAAFLFLTEQWERYDVVDPDGSLVRAYCASLRGFDNARARIGVIASRTGRPDPCPPLPVAPRTTTETTGHQGPIGSWPTSPGTGWIGGSFGI